MTRIATLLSLLAICIGSGVAAAQSGPPPEPPPAWQQWIGDYLRADTLMIVLERGGQLRLRSSAFRRAPLKQVAGNNFTAGNRSIDLTGDTLTYDGRRFLRRNVGNGTFRITPVRPVEELRVEALAASPPRQP